jgi:hypothetical protein
MSGDRIIFEFQTNTFSCTENSKSKVIPTCTRVGVPVNPARKRDSLRGSSTTVISVLKYCIV